MSTWMNDAVPNHNGNGFPHMNDPNAANAGAMMDPSAFLANSAQAQAQAQAQFNSAQQQFNQSQQQQQQMPAPMRNASPSFQNPVYQTNSVIPSKRPRPREDSLAGSPRQNPGMLPTSRSETPQQQSFAGYQPGAVPQQNPGQFPHLQPNGSANASPSPIMANQMRPGSVPQRVATASPHPFSPSAQQFGQQASPIPSEHGTPQPNPYMQNLPQGFNPNYAPSPSNARPSPNPNAMAASQMMAQQMGQMPQHMNQMQNSMYPPQMSQQQQAMQQQAQQQGQQPQPGQPQSQQQSQQRLQGMSDQQKMAAYQMRLQQQLQGGPQLQAQMQAQNMGRGMVPKQQMPGMANGQMPQGAMRPQQRMMAVPSPEQFMKNLTTLMNAKGLPLDTNPMIGDRPVNLMMLFQAVQGRGGYKVVTASNTWPHIAQMIGLQPQIPTVPPTLKQIYERNLYKFEEVWMAQQKQRLMQQQHAQQGQQQQQQPSQQQPQQPPTPQHQQSMNMGNQATPQKPMPSMPQMVQGQMMQPGQQPQMQQQQTPMKPMQPPVNGFSTPQLQNMPQPNMMPGHNRNSLSVDPAGPNDMAMASPAPRRVGSMGQNDGRQAVATVHEQRMPRLGPQSEEYSPCSRELSTYGGVDLNAFSKLGAELERWKPDVPPIQELGNIDVGALTRSLQSGIHGEVRLALDALAAISCSNMPAHVLQLRYCDDLVDALIECAEEQVDMLAEHTVEVADEIQITPYEDVLRACRIERCSIRETPVFGTTEYQLEKAVGRIICITTILRNVSFPGEQNDNHHFLADELVIKFLCVVIRYLGTRNMLLRSHNNTLDFMKDVVVLLSNIAGSIEIPGREQAYCLLQFLLAFAPSPNPTVSDGTLFFTPYEPSLHPYLPHAVDALAKLLARDVPNRTHYKTVFALDSGSTPYELLTRAFALAICPLPDKVKQQVRPPNFPSLVEVRKPFLMQGLLAADILASVAPGPDTGVAKAWLSCDNGLAQNLFRLVRELSQIYESPQIHGGPRMPPRKDPELVYIVMVAISLLRRLIEKSGDPNDPMVKIPADFIPSPQALLDAMSMPSPEWGKEGLMQHLLAIFKLGK